MTSKKRRDYQGRTACSWHVSVCDHRHGPAALEHRSISNTVVFCFIISIGHIITVEFPQKKCRRITNKYINELSCYRRDLRQSACLHRVVNARIFTPTRGPVEVSCSLLRNDNKHNPAVHGAVTDVSSRFSYSLYVYCSDHGTENTFYVTHQYMSVPRLYFLMFLYRWSLPVITYRLNSFCNQQ